MTAIPQDWPNRDASALIRVSPVEWHVQVTGAGPDVLLLHGSGASGHSWRGLAPLLEGYRRIVPDLPGQGFSRALDRQRLGIDAMAADLAALIAAQGWRPRAIIGHSAGAALALRLAEVLPGPAPAVIGINAALGTFDGMAGWLFPVMARVLAVSPFVGRTVARISAGGERVERILEGTGSRLDPEGVRLYRQLVAMPSHVEGTLGMMAQWDLGPLLSRLGRVAVPVLLIASEGDRTVPAEVSRRAARVIPGAEYAAVPRLGHLVQEEAPEVVAAVVLPWLSRQEATAPSAAG